MLHDEFIDHLATLPSLDSMPAAADGQAPKLANRLPDGSENTDMIAPASAAIAGQGVIGFVAGVSQQAREDVLNSYTYATLAADKRYNVITQNGEWYGVFREAMRKALNWAPQDISFSYSKSREKVLGMDKVGLKLLASTLAAAGTGGAAGPLILQVASEAVEALKDNDEPLTIFDSRTKKSGGTRFMVGGCSESEDGVIVLAVGAVELATSLNSKKGFFMSWNSVEVDIQRSADVFVLNQSLYAARRHKVRDALLATSDSAFLEFPI